MPKSSSATATPAACSERSSAIATSASPICAVSVISSTKLPGAIWCRSSSPCRWLTMLASRSCTAEILTLSGMVMPRVCQRGGDRGDRRYRALGV